MGSKDNPDEEEIPESLAHLYDVGDIEEDEADNLYNIPEVCHEEEEVKADKDVEKVYPHLWSWTMSRDERWSDPPFLPLKKKSCMIK